MNKEIFEKFIENKISTTLMAKELNVSISTVRYYLNKYNLKSNIKRGKRTAYFENCKVCSKVTENGKMYCSSSCKSKQHFKDNKDKYSNSNHLIKVFKLAALDYCGKACKHCGYNKNPESLAFHHVDPSQKDYQVSSFKRSKLNDNDRKELDKCITLCHNCHAIVHDNIEKLKNKSLNKQAIKGAKVRRELIDLKDGKCNSCGLKSNINRVYAFHHIDPNTKEFNIDARVCNGYKFERLVAEVNKCVLLCHNCHSEHHSRPICIS